MADPITVEVTYATPVAQPVFTLVLPAGAQVANALADAAVRTAFGDTICDTAKVGIFAKLVERSQALRDGDRVELYRALTADPKVARRKRAAKKSKTSAKKLTG